MDTVTFGGYVDGFVCSTLEEVEEYAHFTYVSIKKYTAVAAALYLLFLSVFLEVISKVMSEDILYIPS